MEIARANGVASATLWRNLPNRFKQGGSGLMLGELWEDETQINQQVGWVGTFIQ